MKKVLTSLLGIVLIATMLIFTVRVNAAGNSVTKDGKVYNKIETLEELTDGNYLIGNSKGDKLLGSLSGTYYSAVEYADSAIVLNITNSASGVLIKDGDLYISAASKGKVSTLDSPSTTSYWKVTIDDNGGFVLTAPTAFMLQYNAQSPRFACYNSSQQKLALYKEDSSTSLEMYLVTFYDGEDVFSSKEYSEGSNLADVEIPTKDGYVFGGWYKDAELTMAWDSSVDTVTSDITLYAKWNEVNYTKITSIDELVSAQYYIASTGTNKFVSSYGSTRLYLSDISEATPITIKNEGEYYSLSMVINGEIKYLGHTNGDSELAIADNCDNVAYQYNPIYENDSFILQYKSDDNRALKVSSDSEYLRAYDSKSATFKGLDLYRIKGTEIEETPVVATKFMESETKASLRLTYDAETLTASDVDLRFGVTLSADAYVEGAKYGVIAMPASLGEITSGIQDYASVEEYLAANSNCTAIAATNIAKVNELGEADENGSYYQFAWVINNMEGHYGDAIIAVCYMEYEGKLYFNVVKQESVLTVVDKYLASTGLSEEVLTVLENLKNNQ